MFSIYFSELIAARQVAFSQNERNCCEQIKIGRAELRIVVFSFRENEREMLIHGSREFHFEWETLYKILTASRERVSWAIGTRDGLQ